jgi:hypothetical protein
MFLNSFFRLARRVTTNSQFFLKNRKPCFFINEALFNLVKDVETKDEFVCLSEEEVEETFDGFKSILKIKSQYSVATEIDASRLSLFVTDKNRNEFFQSYRNPFLSIEKVIESGIIHPYQTTFLNMVRNTYKHRTIGFPLNAPLSDEDWSFFVVYTHEQNLNLASYSLSRIHHSELNSNRYMKKSYKTWFNFFVEVKYEKITGMIK